MSKEDTAEDKDNVLFKKLRKLINLRIQNIILYI